jgi:hypothetical protein
VAKGVRLVPVQVLDCQGSGTISGVIAGVDWVTANAPQAAVANMSLGGGASTSLDSAVRKSIASGVPYAVAAGNDGKDACNYSPARTAEALTIGATASTDSSGALAGSEPVTVTDPLSDGTPISLTARGYKVKGVQHADLPWSGASTTSVDVFRNGAKVATTANDGTHTDNIGVKGGGSYTYKLCDAGTTTCSDTITVTF